MYEIPTSIHIGEQSYNIRCKGDYRMVLDCFAALDDNELTKEERVYSCLIIFYEDLNSIEDLSMLPSTEEAIKKMYWFFNCGQDESNAARSSFKLIDWQKDEQIISAAVNNVSGKEIRLEPYIHWWTFMGYYMSIGESVLSTVVSIRNKIAKQKKLEKHEQEFRKNNPGYFNWESKPIEQREDEERLRQLWNS